MPGGYMGKMLVYKSGAVKLKLGETLFDVSPIHVSKVTISMLTPTQLQNSCISCIIYYVYFVKY